MSPQPKCQKVCNNDTPITFGLINAGLGKEKIRKIKILLDSGSSGTLIKRGLTRNLRVKHDTKTTWHIASGGLTAGGRVSVEFALPEFHPERRIKWEMHPAENLGYDVIIGQDLMQELGIVIDFARDICIWDRAELPMKSRDATSKEVFHIKEPDGVTSDLDCIKKILDAKYEPANLRWNYVSKSYGEDQTP